MAYHFHDLSPYVLIGNPLTLTVIELFAVPGALLGTALYPSPAVMAEAVRASQAEILTVSLRRENAAQRTGQDFWALIRDTGATVLPNTAGCHSVKEAVTTAAMARELFDTPWIKLEVIANDDTLQPDLFGLVEAASVLAQVRRRAQDVCRRGHTRADKFWHGAPHDRPR